MQETITIESGEIFLHTWRGLKTRKRLTLGTFHRAIFNDNVTKLVPMLQQQSHLRDRYIMGNIILVMTRECNFIQHQKRHLEQELGARVEKSEEDGCLKTTFASLGQKWH